MDWVGYRTDLGQAFVWAAGMPGQNSLRMVWRLFQCMRAPQRLTPSDFFRMGLYRPELTRNDLRAYLGGSATARFNRLLNGPNTENETAALNDKLETSARLVATGVQVAEVRAVFPGRISWPGAEKLESVDDMVAYLLRPDSTPCFGKPIFGGLCRGVVAIEAAVGEGRLLLGDGRVVDATRLAAELIAAYGKGYMFQELLRASDDIRPLSGPVLPVVRVYSLWVSGDARPVYAVLRLPSPGSMSDDDAKPGCIRLLVDLKTGAILRGQDMAKEFGEPVTVSALGEPFAGKRIADWQHVIDTSVAVHRQFPRHRSLGIDLGLSHRGVVVNEANASPVHLTYQLTGPGGLLNAELRPIFREVLAERGVTKPQPGTPWPWV